MAKRGRPSGINFDIVKTIKINESQLAKWDPKKIKSFLDGNYDNDLLFKDFRRLYQIMNLYLIGSLSKEKIATLAPVLEELERMEETYTFE